MNDLLPLPDTWRDQLASYPREAVIAGGVAVLLAIALLLVRKPRLLLQGAVVLVIAGAGIAAGILATGAGGWTDRDDQRRTVIAGGIAAVTLVLSLRLSGDLRRTVAHRRLVRDVRNDPQKLRALALAPEVSVGARRKAVKLLDDPFTLDEIARRSRSGSVQKLAKRRLERVRGRRTAARTTPTETSPDVTSSTGERDRSERRDGRRGGGRDAGPGIVPESFYLPPEER